MVNYLIDKSIQNLERCRNELNTIVVCIVKSSILPPTVKTSFVSGTRSASTSTPPVLPLRPAPISPVRCPAPPRIRSSIRRLSCPSIGSILLPVVALFPGPRSQPTPASLCPSCLWDGGPVGALHPRERPSLWRLGAAGGAQVADPHRHRHGRYDVAVDLLQGKE